VYGFPTSSVNYLPSGSRYVDTAIKKIYYKMIDGKETQSLYISRYYEDENQVFFKLPMIY